MRSGNSSTHLVHSDYVKQSQSRQRLGGRPGEIMLAARALFEKQGVTRTSIKDIAKESHITRELVYYYYPDKHAIIAAVIDDFIEDLVESALVWNELREFGDMKGSLKKSIETFRRALDDQQGQRPMYTVLDELGCRDEFRIRAVRETVNAFDKYIIAEYASYHKIEIKLVHEMLCVMLFGLVGLVRMDPKISDEALMTIVEQTLHLDMKSIEPLNTPEDYQ